MLKFFDVVGFDMSNMISLDYTPGAVTWLPSSSTYSSSTSSGVWSRVAVADVAAPKIFVYQAEGDQAPLMTIDIHSFPVK